MQNASKFEKIGIGLILLFLALKAIKLSESIRSNVFITGSLAVISTTIVGIYTHLHPKLPAEILPLEYKPPVMGIPCIPFARNHWQYIIGMSGRIFRVSLIFGLVR